MNLHGFHPVLGKTLGTTSLHVPEADEVVVGNPTVEGNLPVKIAHAVIGHQRG